MTARFATPDEITSWNDHILSNPDKGNIFQGSEFAAQKQMAGWTPKYIIIGGTSLLAIEKNVPILGKLWYIPKGPGVNSFKMLFDLTPILWEFAAKQGVFTIKIEPELALGTDMSSLHFTPTRAVQPNFSTVLLDISKDLDSILMDLPQKGRHAIRRAERDGVSVKLVQASPKNCLIMYNLLKETAEDHEFGIRSADYYMTYWQRYEKVGIGQLFFAYFEGEMVAGAYALAFGTKGTYKDGASIRKRTAYGASHLLQWRVIEWLKTKDVEIHDLCGAPPIDQIKNPDHPHYGIGLFKTSFNKEVTQYVGAYEIPIRSLKSKLWTQYIEKIVRRLYYKKHHESYY
ncbi:MAG: peptidoglycan bridge formation glycyltransferase FemA/FemB family protein [Candidatus Saccharimonadales bacterium]